MGDFDPQFGAPSRVQTSPLLNPFSPPLVMCTGLTLDKEAMRAIAANVMDATRKFNLREGLKPEDDCLPPRFHHEALESGKVITESDMKTLLQDYYRHRGWSDRRIPPEIR
jgi:aldehyde:ferredoxin oxidoreductase